MSTARLAPDDALLPAPVLVVEDDPLMRQRLSRVLGEIGYTQEAVTFSVNLAEARAHVRNQPVAMVLVDLGLPDGSGRDLLREIRPGAPRRRSLVRCGPGLRAMCSRNAMTWR